MKIFLKNGKLIVKQSNLNHENHATDKVTYEHYPENMRIPPEQLPEVERMIALGANKQLLKLDLMSNGAIIPLKALHNVQTAVKAKKQNQYEGADDLEKVLSKLQQIPNAKVRVVTSEENELIGKHFCNFRNFFRT